MALLTEQLFILKAWKVYVSGSAFYPDPISLLFPTWSPLLKPLKTVLNRGGEHGLLVQLGVSQH